MGLTLRCPDSMAVFVRVVLLALSILWAFGVGCGGGGNTGAPDPGPSRSFSMGFTLLLHERTPEALEDAFAVIARDGDLLVVQHDNGIPWQAAKDNNYAGYPQEIRDEIDIVIARKAAMPNHRLYLAVTPIAFQRDRLAPTLGAAGSQTFLPPWDNLAFNNPDVVTAFTNHCRILIEKYRPDAFAFGIEANLLYRIAEDNVWLQYLDLSGSVYTTLKREYPGLPVFQTIQAETYYWGNFQGRDQGEAVSAILAASDYLAVSSYPFYDGVLFPDNSVADPSLLPADYFDRLADLAPSKPFVIAETAWPAEDVVSPYPTTIRSSPRYQRAYVEFLLASVDRADGLLVNWLVNRDYDALWDTSLRFAPDAALLRLWKDTGLYDGAGAARPSLDVWREYLLQGRR